MAFTYAITKYAYFGDLKVVFGTWNGSGVTTGELDLSPYFSGKIYHIDLTCVTTKTTPDPSNEQANPDETFPLDSETAITLRFNTDQKGTFKAFGEGN